eukprot:scaffold10223_cov26-Prasinocladus_malaysianus.AAC.1
MPRTLGTWAWLFGRPKPFACALPGHHNASNILATRADRWTQVMAYTSTVTSKNWTSTLSRLCRPIRRQPSHRGLRQVHDARFDTRPPNRHVRRPSCKHP